MAYHEKDCDKGMGMIIVLPMINYFRFVAGDVWFYIPSYLIVESKGYRYNFEPTIHTNYSVAIPVWV